MVTFKEQILQNDCVITATNNSYLLIDRYFK